MPWMYDARLRRSSAVSFAAIDQRARAGEPLTVVFFGASLTWGANATDPQLTSYRGLMMQHLRERYPRCPFTFFDAFVRNGGYVAGVAMGLTGFLKLLWEPNRQAVEDRIASTVVVKN